MDSIETRQREIASKLERFLQVYLPRHEAREVYHYALLPPGKLLRPLLVRSIAWDLGNDNPQAHAYFELFVEVHHVYTLVHDDLPCMDDDANRRGRPATHHRFNEWKALLTGDGLNVLSYRLLSLIESPRLSWLMRYCTWALGPKGLIHGQYLDLSMEMNDSFEQLITTHRLKTSRLMQTAIVGSALLNEDICFKTLKSLHRLGEHLGIAFQLLDDLCELKAHELSHHESLVNPFLVHRNQCIVELEYRLQKVESLLNNHKLFYTRDVLKDYFQKTDRLIMAHEQTIRTYIGDLLGPIQKILHRLCLGDNVL